MKMTTIALSLLAGFGTGCATLAPTPPGSMSALPNCFDSNYDKERGLFTLRSEDAKVVNQQCLLTVEPRGDALSELLGGIWDGVTGSPRLTAGTYKVYLANGGGGGAGGTLQAFVGGSGGGGGGGAGAAETQATVSLTEGVYKLTIGAGGPGGMAGDTRPGGFGGGVGWAGSPSNMVHVVSGAVVAGTPGADTYTRLTRAQSERSAGKIDGHGGSGPAQATGGHGGVPETKVTSIIKSTAYTSSTAEPRQAAVTTVETKSVAAVQAQAGSSTLASGRAAVGGAPGEDNKHSGSGGGGGGATSMGHGGGGGGESPGRPEIAPERGSLGSGGGGGEGSKTEADAGARGGHGYIALRRI